MPPIWNLQQVLVSLASAGALLWVAILLDRKRSWPAGWSLHLSIPSRDPKPAQFPPCVAVIAARHEAATLPRTLPRLLRQLDHFHRIVIVDDRSEDSTGSTARRLAGSDLDDKVQVVRVDELPDGWASKVNAMHVGIEAATANWDGDHAEQWILLTAADILHPTTSMARMLTKAREHDFDVVSVMAQLRASRVWERLLIPPFVYFSQLLHPFRKASDPQSSVAALAGGCILVRRSTLQDAGGLEAIKDALVDDMALARTLKASGARIWLGIDPDLRSLRTYGSVGEVIDRVSRTAFAALHYRYWALPIAWLGLLLLFIAPPVLATYGAIRLDPMIAGPALLAWLIATVTVIPVSQHQNVALGYALAMPISATVYIYMTLVSAWRHFRGKHEWRDRAENETHLI